MARSSGDRGQAAGRARGAQGRADVFGFEGAAVVAAESDGPGEGEKRDGDGEHFEGVDTEVGEETGARSGKNRS